MPNYSKSKLKTKCKKMYLKGNSDSLATVLGGTRHHLFEKSLEGLKLDMKAVAQICEVDGVPAIFNEDLFFDYKCWKTNIGNEIMSDYDIVSVESKEESTFKHGKPICQVKITDYITLQGMLDLLAFHRAKKRYAVIDWKSGYIKDFPELELVCNGMLAMESNDLDEVDSMIYSVATDMTYTLPMKIEDRAIYVKLISDAVDKFENMPDDYTEVSTLCQYCGLRPTCPDYLAYLLGKPAINPGTTKLEHIDEYFRMRMVSTFCTAEAKKLHEAIKADFGMEETSDKENLYYFKGRNSSKFNVKSIYSSMEDMNLDPEPMLTITATKIGEFLADVKETHGKEIWKAAKDIIASHTKKTMGTPSLKKKPLKKLS